MTQDEMNRPLPLFGFLVVLNMADVLLTAITLQLGGTELNPVFAWLFPDLSTMQAIVVVKVFALAFLQSMWKYMSTWVRLTPVIAYAILALYHIYNLT